MSHATQATCPICTFPGEVRDLGSFGFSAHCSECYEGDEEAAPWRRMQGHGDTAEMAVDRWLELAREFAAIDEVPTLVCRHRPVYPIIVDVLEHCVTEFAWQKRAGWHLVEIVEFEWVDGVRFEREARYLETECQPT